MPRLVHARSSAAPSTIDVVATALDLDHLLGEWGRLISQRTRAAIAARKQAGTYRGGVVAHPPEISAEVERIIVRAHDRGRSLRAICRQLEADGIPAPRGQRWHHHTIARVLKRAQDAA